MLAAAAAASFVTPAYADELVTNGDFSAGLTGFSTTYDTVYNGGTSPNQGYITITQNPDSLCSSCFISVGDHTTGTGNMIYLDGAATNNRGAFWSQTFAVAANSDYAVSLWASNPGTAEPLPTIRATVNGVTVIPATILPPENDGPTTWRQYTGSFASGAATSVTFSLFSDTATNAFNDFIVDNISFSGPAAVAVAGVPEPATWAMMIAGFGLVGGAMRRRSARPVLV